MPLPTSADVHVDTPLSGIATAYKNQAYVARLLFPDVEVQKQSDKFYTWDKSYWFRNEVEQRSPGGEYPIAGVGLSTDNYFCLIYHLGASINDEELENQDPAVQLEQTKAEYLADQFLLNLEDSVASDFFTTGVWGTDVTGGTNFTKWSDTTNSDPIGDIDTAKNTIAGNTGREPNKLAMGRQVWDILKRHPDLLDIYKHTTRGILTQEQVAAALGVDQLIVGNSVKTTDAEGSSSFTYTYIWGKNALMLYVPQRPGLRVPAAGMSFVWPLVGPGLQVRIERLRDDLRDRTLLKGKHAFDAKVTGKDLGYFLSSAVA